MGAIFCVNVATRGMHSAPSLVRHTSGMGVKAAVTSSEPSNRSWTARALIALLTPLAAIIVALVLAGLFAPWGLYLPLAMAAFNVLRVVKGISIGGPTAGRITLLVLNAALAALAVIGLFAA